MRRVSLTIALILIILLSACSPRTETVIPLPVTVTDTETLIVTAAPQNTTLTSSVTPSVVTQTPAVGLPLERLDIHPRLKWTHYRDNGTQVHVMVDTLTLPPLLQFSAFPVDPPLVNEEREQLLQIDYAKHFTVCASVAAMPQAGPQVKIEKVWQEDSTLYVWAYFDPKPSYLLVLPGDPYDAIPFDAVRVKKESLSTYGEMKVVLLDQDGAVKAESTCIIPRGAPLHNVPVTYLPLQQGDYAPDGSREKYLEGDLLLENGAVYLKDIGSWDKYLVIWPRGCTAWLEDGYLWVGKPGSGSSYPASNFQAMVEDRMRTTGSPIDAKAVEECIGKPLPPGVAGPFWYVEQVHPFLT